MKKFKHRFLLLIGIISFGGFFSQLDAQTFRKRNGTVKTRYPDKKIASKGKVKNQLKTGEWNYWDEEGNLIRTEHYRNNNNKCYSNTVLDGSFITYHSSGQIDSTGNYYRGNKTGEWKTFDKYGRKTKLMHYDSLGHEVGIQQEWDIRGLPIQYTVIGADTIETNYTYGGMGFLESKIRTVNGKFDGTQIYYRYTLAHPEDSIIKTAEYKNGKLNGTTVEYYENGSKKKESHYLDGVQVGKETAWGTSNQMQTESYYKNGKLDSVYKVYRRNQLYEERYYTNGILNGKSIIYLHFSNKPDKITWWKNGEFDSAYSYYDNGKIRSKEYPVPVVYEDNLETVKHSDLIKHTEYDTLGRKESEYVYNFSTKKTEGTEKYFYPNGKISCVVEHEKGIKTAHLKKYNPSGKIIIDATAEHGRLSNDLKVWDKNGKALTKDDPNFEKYVNDNLPLGFTYTTPKNHITEGEGDLPPIDPFPVMPEFPGGQEAMMKFIRDNTKYPDLEKESGKQGTVYIEFTVEKDGSVTNIKVRKEVAGAPGLTKEAIRVIKTMPKWTPGIGYDGKPESVIMTIPIRFVLK